MKKSLLLILMAMIFSIHAYAQIGVSIGRNEKIDFEIYYAFVTGGRLTMLTEEVEENGEKLIHLVAKGNTVGLVDKIYHIMEDYEAWSDPATLLPKRALKNVRESASYKRYINYYFDHEKHTVKSTHSGDHKIEKECYDIIAACFKIRTMDLSRLTPGQTIKLNTFFGEENWPLILKYICTEDVKISKLGKIRCYKFVPTVEEAGVFTDKEALKLWISADGNKIPIRAQCSLMLGSAKVDIVNYSGLLHAPTFRK